MNEDLQNIAQLTINAGRKIMQIYAMDFEVYNKQDTSPVTQADQQAEAIILAGLNQTSPNIPIIAEEIASENKLPTLLENGNGTFFMVDPLDGTKEFINKRDEFTVNIAKISNRQAIMGVIYVPAFKTLYIGDIKQKLALKIQLNDKADLQNPISIIDISHKKQKNHPLKILASRSHINQQTQAYIENLKQKNKGDIEIVNIGSSYKLCLLAEGKADIYPRFGLTMEWDIAAGHAILSAAGGAILQPDETPFLYGKQRQKFLNGNFIAKSNSVV